MGQEKLRAKVLGQVELQVGERVIPDTAWERRSSRNLLLLLLCQPGHRLSRDLVLESLWPNASLETATRALYVAIHGLRRVLEPKLRSGKASRFVQLVGESLQLAPESIEWLDVDEFEAALDTDGDRRERLAKALPVYAGDLLEAEPYLDWPAARRELLRWHWREAVLEMAELERQAGRPLLAVPSVERILESDPGDELAYRVLMTACAEADRREDARRVFERCVSALQSELGVEPNPETVALWEAIRDQPVTPPAVAVVTQMDNLPRSANPLLGRGRDTEELLDLICDADVELVTVTGTGGLGKTRTAIEVASLARDAFEHGVCFVPLAHIHETTLVMPAIASALGLEEVPGRSSLQLVQDRLHDASLLLLLDNFEQVEDAATEVAAILEACANVTILVTSRVPLRLRAEHTFSLEPLATPNVDRPLSLGRVERYPSVELFAQRASAVRRSFALTADNVEAIAQICAQLDGVPLAIELAAARIRHLTPQALLAGLEDRFGLLSGGYRDMPPRHQTMRAAIGWSYDLLDPREQDVFRRLGVFEGGFGVDAATQIVFDDVEPFTPDEVAGLLAGLAEQGLLRTEDDLEDRRYGMFETIREYARDELKRSGAHEETRRRHALWYVQFVNRAAPELVRPEQDLWFERLEVDFANIRAALAFVQTHAAGGEESLQIVAGLWRYWWKLGRIEEGRNLIDQATENAIDRTSDHLGWALYAGSQLSEGLGDNDRAEKQLTEALAIFRANHNERGMGDVLDLLGIVFRNHGDLDRSQELQEEALALQRRVGNRRGMAGALNGLGSVGYYRGDLNMANRYWSEAAEIVRELGDHRSLVLILGNLTAIATLEGDTTRALEISLQLMANARRLGDDNLVTHGLASLGSSHLARGDLHEAKQAYEEALDKSRKFGMVQIQAVALYNLGRIALRQDDQSAAMSGFTESLQHFVAMENSHGTAGCLEVLGGMAVDQGADEAPLRWLAVAARIREDFGLAREAEVDGEDDVDDWLAIIRGRMGDVEFEKACLSARELKAEAIMHEVLASVAEW